MRKFTTSRQHIFSFCLLFFRMNRAYLKYNYGNELVINQKNHLQLFYLQTTNSYSNKMSKNFNYLKDFTCGG